MSYLIDYSKNVINHLENDAQSFLNVIQNDEFKGKLCVAMVTTAMAAFDVYAYILYQNLDSKKYNKELFKELIKSEYFDETKYKSADVFYSQIRCGVVHQIYPKKAGLIGEKSEVVLYRNKNDGDLIINAYALYMDVLRGINKIHNYFINLDTEEIKHYESILEDRIQEDELLANGCNFDLSTLPQWPHE